MDALLPLLACSLMMGVVAVGFLAWYGLATAKSTGEPSEVADRCVEIAEFRRQPPAAPADAASRRGD